MSGTEGKPDEDRTPGRGAASAEGAGAMPEKGSGKSLEDPDIEAWKARVAGDGASQAVDGGTHAGTDGAAEGGTVAAGIERMSGRSGPAGALLQFLQMPAGKLVLIGMLIALMLYPLSMVWDLVKERQRMARTVSEGITATLGQKRVIGGMTLVVPYVESSTIAEGGRREQVVRLAVVVPEEMRINGRLKTRELRRSIYRVTAYDAEISATARFRLEVLQRLLKGAAHVLWDRARIVLQVVPPRYLKKDIAVRVNGRAVEKGVDVLAMGDAALGRMDLLLASVLPGLKRDDSDGAEGLSRSEDPEGSASGGTADSAAGAGAAQGAAGAVTDGGRLSGAMKAGGTALPEALKNGLTVAVDAEFAGGRALDVLLAARKTEIVLESDWPHPAFRGDVMPVERIVGSDGFKVRWYAPALASRMPRGARSEAIVIRAASPVEVWDGLRKAARRLYAEAKERFRTEKVSVSFVQPVDHYRLVNRAVKYGVMFLVTVFGAMFLMELLTRREVHWVQYLLTGLMLVMFFLLLLSISEHFGFETAYVTAAVATGGVLSLYVALVLRRKWAGLVMALVFAALYGVLFVILRMETYALLTGSIAGFIMLTLVMFLTINVNWSARLGRAVQKEEGNAPGSPS